METGLLDMRNWDRVQWLQGWIDGAWCDGGRMSDGRLFLNIFLGLDLPVLTASGRHSGVYEGIYSQTT